MRNYKELQIFVISCNFVFARFTPHSVSSKPKYFNASLMQQVRLCVTIALRQKVNKKE
jgi:hypothetical protein